MYVSIYNQNQSDENNIDENGQPVGLRAANIKCVYKIAYHEAKIAQVAPTTEKAAGRENEKRQKIIA